MADALSKEGFSTRRFSTITKKDTTYQFKIASLIKLKLDTGDVERVAK